MVFIMKMTRKILLTNKTGQAVLLALSLAFSPLFQPLALAGQTIDINDK